MIDHTYTMFQTSWWLDATAPGMWDAVEVEEGGRIVARLPYVVRNEGQITTLTQPPLTQSLGPWSETAPDASASTQLSRQKSLYQELIDGLPSHDRFSQNFAPQVTNWLPFYWRGFGQTTRYTYVLDLNQDEEQLLAAANKNTRKRIRSASRFVSVHVEDDLDVLLYLNDMTFERQGLRTPYPRELVRAIDEAVLKNGHRILTVCRDLKTKEPVAAAYAVGDARRIYMLISGADPQTRDTGAGYLSKWKAITEAKKHTDTFDFEGSMMERIESFNRGFGAIQTPYFQVTRSAPPPAETLRSQLRKTAGMMAQKILRR